VTGFFKSAWWDVQITMYMGTTESQHGLGGSGGSRVA